MKPESMENKPSSPLVFHNSLQQAVIEILGRHEAQKVFSAILGKDDFQLNDPMDPGIDLLQGICDEFSILYQPNTARGLLLRIGDAAFPILRRKLENLNAMGSIENRVQPFERKFESSIAQLAQILSSVTGIPVEYDAREGDCYYLRVADGSLRQYFFAGILRAFGEWLDSRRDYFATVQSKLHETHPDQVCLCVRPAH